MQAIPYLGSHRILKIFTPDAGLLTLIAKHIKTNTSAVTSPFCKAEWVYCPSKGDIHPLKDATLIDPMQDLRKNYEILSAAGSIARDILQSQMPDRASKGLYELLVSSFHHLHRNPTAIAQSFRLKLLQYEGLIRLQQACLHCEAKSEYLSRGESICKYHALAGSIFLTEEEWPQLLVLGLSRRFSEIISIAPTPHLIEKIEQLFSERMK